MWKITICEHLKTTIHNIIAMSRHTCYKYISENRDLKKRYNFNYYFTKKYSLKTSEYFCHLTFWVKIDWKYVLDQKLREKSDSQDIILKFNQTVVLNSLPESNPKPEGQNPKPETIVYEKPDSTR